MRSKPMILFALLLAAFLINLDTTLVNVALPALVRELHATTTQLQWVVDSYNLVFAALLLTFGSLSDRFGRKGMLLAGLAVVGTASLAGGFTTDPAQLIAARSVMGLGAAMTFPATLSLISNVFTERGERAAPSACGARSRRGHRHGTDRGGLAAGALQLGQHLHRHGAGRGLARSSWRLSFWCRRTRRRSFRHPGLVLSSATMALLDFTIIERRPTGWEAAAAWPPLPPRRILLAAFIVASGVPRTECSMYGCFASCGPARPAAQSRCRSLPVGFIFLMTQYFEFVRGGPLSTGVRRSRWRCR